MSKSSIDDIIKKALEQIESNPRNADWDSFESMLEGNELTDFDQHLKEKLENISPPNDGAWNRFEDKYAEELGNPHPVDEVVKDSLKGHESAFVENSWNKLSALLDLTDKRERELLIKKIAEISAVSLILFLLIPQFFNSEIDKAPIQETQYAQQNVKAEDEAGHQSSSPGIASFNEHHSTGAKSGQTSNDSEQEKSQISNPAIPSSTTNAHKHSNTQMTTNQRTSNNLNVLSSLPLQQAKRVNNNGNGATQRSNAFAIKNTSLLNSTEASIPLDLVTPGDSDLTATEKVPYLPVSIFEEAYEDYYPQVQLIDNNHPSNTSLAVVAAPQFTHIYTPKDPVYNDPKLNIQPYGRVQLFHAMGLEIEKQHNEFSIGGNISYSKLSYRPPTIVEKYDGSISVVASDTIRNGYRELSLVNLELQMASVSLFMRQYFPLAQNMRLFAHLGSGINMVMKSDYLIHNVTNKGNGKRIVEQIEFNNDEEYAAMEHVKLREKNFEGGILEGGNFNRNSYMDVEFGGGFEYDLNEECSVYLASIFNYSPFSDGLGPNRDKINSLNFQFGIKQLL